MNDEETPLHADPDQPETYKVVDFCGLPTFWLAFNGYRSLGECAADDEISRGATEAEAIAEWRRAQAERDSRST